MSQSAPISTPQQLGAFVRALRKAKGLTQAEVAQMLGVSKMRVATIEKNIGRVSTASVMQLVHLLGGTIHLASNDLPQSPDGVEPPTERARSLQGHRTRGEW